MITKVTITGADDSINPGELLMLSREFSFVEWGILVSASNEGIPRFPSLDWLNGLKAICDNHYDINLSIHVCGRYVRELMAGENQFFIDYSDFLPNYHRVQLNYHNIPHIINFNGPHFTDLLLAHSDKEFIFQYDDVNQPLILSALASGVNTSTLFDRSGGKGLLPNQWPKALPNIKCGYAGGLSSENLREQIPLILEAACGRDVWIDAETHVRSNNDQQFDLVKVREFLEICREFVGLRLD